MIGYNILPIGFSSYEKSTIEIFFRLAGRRAPHWALTDRPNEARVVLFNAASDQDIANFRSLVASWQKVIIVGNSDFGTGWPVVPRPIKLTAILTLLDDIAKFKTHDLLESATETLASAASPVAIKALDKAHKSVVPFAVDSVKPPVLSKASAQTVSKPTDEAPSNLATLSAAEQLRQETTIINNEQAIVIGRVLLVDDSEIALKYMQNRLRHFGYSCDLVRSGEEALTMVSTHSYQFVFLDVMMAGLDGYQTCKAIKNNKARRGPAPLVVMLTSKGGAIDKIRGSMSGCDAYLTKPLNDNRLSAVLAKFDQSTVAQRWEAANPTQPIVDTLRSRNSSK